MTLLLQQNLDFAWGATTASSTSANIGYPGWQSSVIHRNWLDLILVVLK